MKERWRSRSRQNGGGQVAVSRIEKSLARFQRAALVLSGGGALGAYQAGAFAALDAVGFEPTIVAGCGVGAINAAIIAGNAPQMRVPRLRAFWNRVGEAISAGGGESRPRWWRTPWAARRGSSGTAAEAGRTGWIAPYRLNALLTELVDFGHINAGVTRLTIASTHLATGAEILFDNDRCVLGPEHVLASLPPSSPRNPVVIDGEPYGGEDLYASLPMTQLFDGAPPADTLCFVVDGFDAEPGRQRGISRARQEIAALRRRHDLQRMIGVIGERLPPEWHAEPDIAGCLAHGSRATMTLVHLVHESDPADLVRKLRDFSQAAVRPRWHAGERDAAASLNRAAWLAPPPRRVGIVVHEMRGGGVPTKL